MVAMQGIPSVLDLADESVEYVQLHCGVYAAMVIIITQHLLFMIFSLMTFCHLYRNRFGYIKSTSPLLNLILGTFYVWEPLIKTNIQTNTNLKYSCRLLTVFLNQLGIEKDVTYTRYVSKYFICQQRYRCYHLRQY